MAAAGCFICEKHATPGLSPAILAACARQREYWGTRVDEWPGAPRGDADDVAALIERLRGVS